MKCKGPERDLCFFRKRKLNVWEKQVALAHTHTQIREFEVSEIVVKQLKKFKSLCGYCTQIIFQIIRRIQGVGALVNSEFKIVNYCNL